MKFIKGVLLGTAVTMAAYLMCTEGMVNKKRIMKQARRWANKMGIDC